jgi:phosphatidylglycerol---prolipoprotein diacylglyceryl transferase
MPGTTGRPVLQQRPTRSPLETTDKPEVPQASVTGPFRLPAPGAASAFDRAMQPMLAATYWFEPIPAPGEPYTVIVRFTGKRTDVGGKFHDGDRFSHDEILQEVVPGSGPISITAKIRDVNPGAWDVSAQILNQAQADHSTHRSRRRASRAAAQGSAQGTSLAPEEVDRPDTWLWRRWAPSVEWTEEVKTGLEAFARVPGTFPFIWVTFVGLGMVAALLVQTLLIAHQHLHLGPVWVWTILAMAFGAAGAKIWFIVKHRSEHRFEGWCIQGFIAGATPAALVIFTVFHLPTGVVLDASAPGLMFGMAVGRVGCFLGGCCVGKPTSASWGIWCSDQHIGARRIPTQLMESASVLILGLVLLLVFLTHGPSGGALLIAALAAYTLVREGLLRLRAEPLKTRGPVTAIVAAAILLAAIVAAIII